MKRVARIERDGSRFDNKVMRHSGAKNKSGSRKLEKNWFGGKHKAMEIAI